MSIKVIDLNYTYGAGTAFEQHALKHVNFEINDGEFVGLPLDDDNEPEKSEARISAWCGQLKAEAGL